MIRKVNKLIHLSILIGFTVITSSTIQAQDCECILSEEDLDEIRFWVGPPGPNGEPTFEAEVRPTTCEKPEHIIETILGPLNYYTCEGKCELFFRAIPAPDQTPGDWISAGPNGTCAGMGWLPLANNAKIRGNGIKENNEFKMAVFPNPATAFVNVGMLLPNGNNEQVDFTIYNNVGQKMTLNETVGRDDQAMVHTVDVSQFPSGIYYLVSNTGSSRLTERLIVK